MSIPENNIDFNTIDRFLELLTGAPNPSVNWRFLPDSEQAKANDNEYTRKNFTGRAAEVRGELLDYQEHEYGIFVVVNAGGHSKAEITKVRALFIDCDDRPQPEAWHAPPDFLAVRSATRWHAYWRVDDCPLDQFTTAQKRLIAHYTTDKGVHDLPRVMRVPGTVHHKADPTLVSLEVIRETWEPIRTLKELLDGLPKLVASKPATSSDKATTKARLTAQLARLDPGVGYSEWRDIVAAIRATNLSDGNEDDLRQIAHRWSEGSYSTGKAPDNWEGPYAVDRVFDTMVPRPDGVGYGTVVLAARKAGFSYAEETFGSAPPMTNVVVLAERREQRKNRFMTPDQFKDPPPSLIPGVLLEGETICFYGPPKHGKTFSALDISLALATGCPVFGRYTPLRTGPVLYLSGEGNAGMKARVNAWAEARGVSLNKVPFFLCESAPLTSNGTDGLKGYVDDGQEILAGRDPALVVVDTMAKSMLGLNENDAKDVGKFIDLVDGLRAAFKCAVLVVAHSGKDAGRGLRGSTAGPAGFDGLFSVEQGEGGIIQITGQGFRYTEDRGPFNCRLEKHGESAALALTDGDFHARNDKHATERKATKTKRDELIEIMEHYNVRGDRMRDRKAMAEAMAAFRSGAQPGEKEFIMAFDKAYEELRNGLKSTRNVFPGLWKKDVRPGATKSQIYFTLPDSDDVD